MYHSHNWKKTMMKVKVNETKKCMTKTLKDFGRCSHVRHWQRQSHSESVSGDKWPGEGRPTFGGGFCLGFSHVSKHP